MLGSCILGAEKGLEALLLMHERRETKDQILDAAEKLFADEGFGATSLRRILSEVGLNPAAIHYHFGGKDEVVEALFARRLDPLNAERMQLFDALSAKDRVSAPTIEAIVDAFIAPALKLAARGEEGERFLRFVGRYLHESGPAAKERLKHGFEPVLGRLTELLQLAAPNLQGTSLAWRVHFLVGAMFHAMSCREHVSWIQGAAPIVSLENARAELIAFASAGMRAAAVTMVQRETMERETMERETVQLETTHTETLPRDPAKNELDQKELPS